MEGEGRSAGEHLKSTGNTRMILAYHTTVGKRQCAPRPSITCCTVWDMRQREGRRERDRQGHPYIHT